jgi:hypothetical protein
MRLRVHAGNYLSHSGPVPLQMLGKLFDSTSHPCAFFKGVFTSTFNRNLEVVTVGVPDHS